MAPTAQLLDKIAIERELSRRSFRNYVELAFPYVEPGVPFLRNWLVAGPFPGTPLVPAMRNPSPCTATSSMSPSLGCPCSILSFDLPD